MQIARVAKNSSGTLIADTKACKMELYMPMMNPYSMPQRTAMLSVFFM